MKDEMELPFKVVVENVEKVFVKEVKRIGNSAYVPFSKKFLGREVIVIVTKGKRCKAKKMAQIK